MFVSLAMESYKLYKYINNTFDENNSKIERYGNYTET